MYDELLGGVRRASRQPGDVSVIVSVRITRVKLTSRHQPEGQGNRTLMAGKTGVNRVEDALVPSGAETFAANILFDGSVQLQNI